MGSVISNDMQELNQGKEDISNQIRGHKANLSNPTADIVQSDTSQESKANSEQAIKDLGGESNMLSNHDRSKNAAEKLEGSRVMTS
ncbi:hypothetical protein HJFPF1_10997 [Paramyrothecium foliicola]|nr:hypothetical protein HJFPF1_10997 [Paramyrothecium foliicola]